LYAALFLPEATRFGYGPYPTVVSVYGGPHVQRGRHDWATGNEPRAQALRRDGFLVVMVDNRGSARRGVAFEAHIRHRMGTVEVDDQVAAVRCLSSAGLVDAARVGIYGWSYGGYMTLMCLARAPGVFHAGVSGAPVTAWDGYDTAYTERYMSTPQRNPRGYRDGSIMTHAGSITGALMLVHGLIDENVHARHSWRLVSALAHAGVPFEFLPLPAERHAPRNPAVRAYMERRIADFFRARLLPAGWGGGCTGAATGAAGGAAAAAAAQQLPVPAGSTNGSACGSASGPGSAAVRGPLQIALPPQAVGHALAAAGGEAATAAASSNVGAPAP
jgi:dipeptidyl-peptidase-4